MIRKHPQVVKTNLQHKCIKPENVTLGNKLAFSFNPESQPVVQNFSQVKLTTFSSWSQEVYKVFDRCRYCTIETVMEISAGGRLHFHGYITINKLIEFYFFDLKILKFHGSFEIDSIGESVTSWDEYIHKLKSPMKDFCIKEQMEYIYTSRTN